MADPTPTPTPTKPQRQRGLVSKAHADIVSKTDTLIAIARKPAYATELANREITADFLTALASKNDDARGLLGRALDKTVDKTSAAKAENAAKDTLVTLAHEVQRAAKQKHADDKPEELADYAVGIRMSQSRAALEQSVAGMLEKLKTNTLPGITADKIAALTNALQAYKDTNSALSGAQSDASGTRVTLDTLIADIGKDRRKILFAVEAAWPSKNKANAPIRTEFGLSPNRPYNG